MNDDSLSPYRPPGAVPTGTLSQSTEWLSTSGLVLSSIGLMSPLLIVGLAIFGIIHGDSVLVPCITLLGCLPLSIVALVVSIVARRRHRTGKSLLGILIGILAIPVCLAATWLLTMIGFAGYPV